MRPAAWIAFGFLTGIALGLASALLPAFWEPVHESADGARWIEPRK